MHLLNLNRNEILEDFNYDSNDNYLIFCAPNELCYIKNDLKLDNNTFFECLSFDENIRLDNFENYDFLSVNTFEINKKNIIIKEVNIYLSDNFILVICDKEHFLQKAIFDIIDEIKKNQENIKKYKLKIDETFFKIIYKIIKELLINQFENLEKLEDMILKIEDSIIEKSYTEQIEKINYIRKMSRIIVKNIRPYIYICDKIFNENKRYKRPKDFEIKSINYSIEKLYNFSLSNRELSDKLLDIYSSSITSETNDLITKLTLLTAISSPLTIISGVYGMNFTNMPELENPYGYYITLFVMFFIVIVCIFMFKRKKLL